MRKKYFIFSACMFLLFIMYMCGATSEPTKQTTKLTVTGHRGAAGLSPENTLASIQKAIELKVDRVEIDVHQTKDSVIVIIHDNSINRTTNGKGKIKNLTYEELQQFNIEDSLTIPTLKEALKVIDKRAKLLIEIKEGNDYYPNIEKRILSIIKEYDAENWCIIQSFEDEIIEEIHTQNPNITIHKLLLTGALYDFDKLPYIEEYSVNYFFTTQKLVNKIHSLNKKINSWTVNTEDKIQLLKEMGVDGVITDYPNLLVNE
ncbi:glycerophosphodiester phosphodiesterase [Kordia jejudonensis]|uniref:glycerophosphodiester phosphodiesterase n=1 Tax=Kordia jejudonensis TaxID=1348245 RepID=UPI00062966C0|nr:glycerophosphodiester phosphodiesterase family protein [Kordia jejudonensis]